MLFVRDTDFLYCASCCNTLHYGCIHAACILTYSWNTSKQCLLNIHQNMLFIYSSVIISLLLVNHAMLIKKYISLTSKQIEYIDDFFT